MAKNNYSRIKNLVWKRAFEKDLFAEREIRARAERVGIWLDSTFELYRAIIEDRISGFTVPAINIRTLTFDIACLIFRLMRELNVGPVIFEIARSEIGYTNQPIDEYASTILGAALAERYRGPVFVQGDHFQVSRTKFSDPNQKEKELQEITNLVLRALNSGVYNIDIDASTLVDLTKPSLSEQQKDNCEITARFIRLIRENQPPAINVTIGGEVGEVGGKNSTPEEVETFVFGIRDQLSGSYLDLNKISVQTGTSHGGIVGPDGKLVEVKVDFNALSACSKKAKQLGLAGAVQHGASTLPLELFDKFPETGCVEIHLATEFQNIVYRHLPQELQQEIYQYCVDNFKGKYEWKEELTEEQGFYKTRKRALGPFKKRLWDLTQEIKDPIISELQELFVLLFKKLKVVNTRNIIEDIYLKRSR